MVLAKCLPLIATMAAAPVAGAWSFVPDVTRTAARAHAAAAGGA